MKKNMMLFATLCVVFSALAAHATTLKGSKVRADLFYLNDPYQTNLLSDPLATVGSGSEFLYDDNIATYSINVNATGFSVHMSCDTNITLRKCETEPGVGIFLKDDLFVNATITVDDNTLGLGGGVFPTNPKIIFLIIPPPTAKIGKAVFTVVPTPEPSSIVFLGTGILGLAGVARRRFLA